MRGSIAVFALLLIGCHSQETRDQINAMEENGTIESSAPALAPAAAKPVSIDRKDALVDFHAGWPAEAAAIPALDARFRTEAEKAMKELVAGATADKAMREKDGLEFPGYSSKVDYRVAGASARLLSLQGTLDSFTGGAHGNHGTIAVLWDKQSGKDVGYAGLFAEASSAWQSIREDWCAALDRARAEKRGPDYRPGPNDPFGQCPSLEEIDVIPSDKDGDGRFEALMVVADPYVAGPWAEGDYAIELPVTPAIIGALKPDYRDSFAA